MSKSSINIDLYKKHIIETYSNNTNTKKNIIKDNTKKTSNKLINFEETNCYINYLFCLDKENKNKIKFNNKDNINKNNNKIDDLNFSKYNNKINKIISNNYFINQNELKQKSTVINKHFDNILHTSYISNLNTHYNKNNKKKLILDNMLVSYKINPKFKLSSLMNKVNKSYKIISKTRNENLNSKDNIIHNNNKNVEKEILETNKSTYIIELDNRPNFNLLDNTKKYNIHKYSNILPNYIISSCNNLLENNEINTNKKNALKTEKQFMNNIHYNKKEKKVYNVNYINKFTSDTIDLINTTNNKHHNKILFELDNKFNNENNIYYNCKNKIKYIESVDKNNLNILVKRIKGGVIKKIHVNNNLERSALNKKISTYKIHKSKIHKVKKEFSIFDKLNRYIGNKSIILPKFAINNHLKPFIKDKDLNSKKITQIHEQKQCKFNKYNFIEKGQHNKDNKIYNRELTMFPNLKHNLINNL